MRNPWEEISLSDYESHMKLDSVRQLQAMNALMKGQLDAYPVSSVMILGIAGGNGLEHIAKGRFSKVYGIDINAAYLEEARQRYPALEGVLDCRCIDLISGTELLPHAGLVIANLLVEYIGYEGFQRVIQAVGPQYVSCIIQINLEGNWVSDSPYLHVFDGLDQVHCQMDGQELIGRMSEIGYRVIKTLEYPLPNGKKFVQLDFQR